MRVQLREAVATRPTAQVAPARRSPAGKAPTFREAVKAHLAQHRAAWRPSWMAQVEAELERHVLPAWGDTQWTQSPSGMCSPCWSHCFSELHGPPHVSDNASDPCSGGQCPGSGSPPTRREKALTGHSHSAQGNPPPLRRLALHRHRGGNRQGLARPFTHQHEAGHCLHNPDSVALGGGKVHDVARTLIGRTWEIPAHRMKTGEAHRVPLSLQAQRVLAAAYRRQQKPRWENGVTVAWDVPPLPSALVFPGHYINPKPLSPRTMQAALETAGVLGTTPHGFRPSFRDWAAEQSRASHSAIELALSHKVGSTVEQAYFRSDLLEQRRELMQAWADYCAPSDDDAPASWHGFSDVPIARNMPFFRPWSEQTLAPN